MPSFPKHSATLRVDLNAIRHNWRLLDGLSDSTCQTGAVVKANAYGLGMVPVSHTLYQEGCRLFYTARLHEAISLAESFAAAAIEDAQIIVFDGMMAGQEDAFAAYRLIPVINDLNQLARCQKFALSSDSPVSVIMHIDTAMARLGIEPKQWQEVTRQADWDKGLDVMMLMSHLASADDARSAQNETQLKRFKALTDAYEAPLSLANSGGLLLGVDYHFQASRPGIALYGLSPSEAEIGLQSALTLHADILQIREVEAGDTVGYGASFVAPRQMKLATLGIGYADGLLRHYKEHIMPKIGTIACPLVGRISMDSCVIDVSHLDEATLNSAHDAILFDAQDTPKALAQKTGTICYEIMTTLGDRILRLYDGDDAADQSQSR